MIKQGVVRPIGYVVPAKQFGRMIAYGPFATREEAAAWIKSRPSETFRMIARVEPLVEPSS